MTTPDLGIAKDCEQFGLMAERAANFTHAIPAAAFDGFETRPITTRAGFADCRFRGADFLSLFALPNFLFHYSMAYAIARAEGVPLGEGDFDGFHGYPPGFSFPSQ